MRPGRSVLLLLACLAGLGSALSGPASSQDFPRRPIRLLVGYAAGGSTDVLARLVADGLGGVLGRTVVVENRPGANANIATAVLVRAPPDGYTLFVGGAASAISESLYKDLAFSFPKDFAPVAFIGSMPNIMVVPKSLPAASPEDFVRIAKAGTPIALASSGVGATTHLAGELFRMRTGIEMIHAPYRGSAPALQDLIAGRVQVMFDNLSSSVPFIASGDLRALGVTGAARSPVLPDVPTLKEQGYDVVIVSWTALFAPLGTPRPIVDRINAAMARVLAAPDVRERLAVLGIEPRTMSPEEVGAYASAEVEKFRAIVVASGARIE